jgi:hypothetical protein
MLAKTQEGQDANIDYCYFGIIWVLSIATSWRYSTKARLYLNTGSTFSQVLFGSRVCLGHSTKMTLFIITQPDNIWWGGPLIFDIVFGHSTRHYLVGRAFDIWYLIVFVRLFLTWNWNNMNICSRHVAESLAMDVLWPLDMFCRPCKSMN